MKKKLMRIVSMILVFTMLMCDNGWSLLTEAKVYAAEIEEEDADDADEVVEEVQDSNSVEIPMIVGEVLSERTIYSKTYACSNHSMQTLYYAAPVHYETEDGTLAEVDNSLVKSDDGYENAANSYSVKFKTGAENIGDVSFREKDYGIDFTLVSEDRRNIRVDRASLEELEREEEEEDGLTVSGVDFENALGGHTIKESTIKYVGLKGGVDLVYTPLSNGIKEDIILNDKGVNNEFTYKIDLKGLRASLSSSGEVELSDKETGEIVYIFPAPFMRDANDNYSEDVSYSISLPEYEEECTVAGDVDIQIEDETDETEAAINVETETDEDVTETITEDIFSEEANASLNEITTTVDITVAGTATAIAGEPISTDDTINGNGGSNEDTTETITEDAGEDTLELIIETDLETDADTVLSEETDIDEETVLDIIESDSMEEAEAMDETDSEISGEEEALDDTPVRIASDDTVLDSDCIYLTVTADEEFLKNAAYPVTIDPTVKRFLEEGITDSCTVRDDNSAASEREAGRLVDKKKNIDRISRTYIRFDIPYMAKGSVITSAEFNLAGDINKKDTNYIAAYAISEDWNYRNVDKRTVKDWNSKPKIEEKPLDYCVRGGYLDITKALKDWQNGTKENFGICIGALDETKALSKVSFAIGNTYKRPYLEVSYKNYIGVESYFSSHEVNAGTAGSGYIKDYTGDLTVVNTDVSTKGLRMPFSIGHVYNSNGTGDGWMLNLEEKLFVPCDEVDVNTYPYAWRDSDGTIHYFTKKKVTYLENGAKKTASDTGTYPAAKDEDDLKLYIVPVTDKELKTKYPLKLIDQASSVVKYFDYSGNLCRITDSNQYENGKNANTKDPKEINKIEIGYETTGSYAGYEELDDVIAALEELLNKALAKNVTKAELLEPALTATEKTKALYKTYYPMTDYRVASKVSAAVTQLSKIKKDTKVANTKTFVTNAKKYLTQAKELIDKDGAGIYYDSPAKRIVSVTDAVGNTSKITYDDKSGKISSISDPVREGKSNTYTHDESGRLKEIQFSNGKAAYYTYNSDGFLDSMQDNSGYKVTFTYTKDNVTEVSESAKTTDGSAVVSGQKYTITYKSDNSTVFRFSGVNDIYGDSDDVFNNYVFDESGRIITEYSEYADHTVLGARTYTYDGDVKNSVKTLYDDQAGDPSLNLMNNGNFEEKDKEWKEIEKDTWGDAGAVNLYSGEHYFGSHGGKIVNQVGQSAGFYQKRNLNPGIYTLIYYVRTKDYIADVSRSTVAVYDGYGTCIGGSPISDTPGWTPQAFKFEVKECGQYGFYFWADGVGTTYFDEVQLLAGDHTNMKLYDSEAGTSATAESKEKKEEGRHKIKDVAVTGLQTSNYLTNHSFENDIKGKKGIWQIDDPSKKKNAVTAASKAYFGVKSLSFAMATLQKNTAVVSEVVEDLKPGTYTLSSYARAESLSGSKAYLQVEDAGGKILASGLIDANKTESSSDSLGYAGSMINATTDTTFNNGWERLATTFTIESETSVKVKIIAEGEVDKPKGIIYFDALQLEEGNIVNIYNALEDGSFENTKTTLPYNWKNLGKGVADQVKNGGIDGSKYYHITGEVGRDKNLTCVMNLGSTNASYVLSGYIQCDTTPSRDSRPLRVSAKHEDSNSKYESILNLESYGTGWKYFSLILPSHPWNSTTISFQFYDNIGDLYIDGLQLTKNDIYTNTYNSKGQNTGKNKPASSTQYTYDTYGRKRTETSDSGFKKTYSYNKTGDLSSVTVSQGSNAYMTYDKFGNELTLSNRKPAEQDENGKYIKKLELYAKNTYTDNGNFLASTTGNNGATSTYSYDEKSGKIGYETLPAYDGDAKVAVAYDYDSSERLSSVTRKGVNADGSDASGTNERSIKYTYGAFSDLTGIEHNGFTYGYTYDEFGNVLTTSVAGTVTQTNTYNPGNGSLKSTTYADGSTQRMTYDDYGNLKAILADDKEISHYTYYDDGNLARVTDELVGVDTTYEYNQSGKIVRSKVNGDVKGIDYSSRLQYAYDKTGAVSRLDIDINNRLDTYTYSHAADGKITNVTLPTTMTVAYRYDTLRRNSSTVFAPRNTATDAKKLYTQIKYASGESSDSKKYSGTQNLIAKYYNRFGSSGNITQGYDYTYDARGNILTINNTTSTAISKTTPENTTRRYTYNDFDEVVTAKETYSDGTTAEYTYVYDDGGNITSETVKKTDKSGKVIAGVKPSHTYTYDTVWKDKLIAYDTKPIEYDISGNPTNYMGRTMTWNTVSNSLISITGKKTKTNEDLKCIYDYYNDGKRISKTVNGVTTVYVYNDGLLINETSDKDRINYYYSSDGEVIEIGYQIKNADGTFGTEAKYFYSHNAQGDIVAIYRSSDSALMGTYDYDLWGNVVVAENNADKNGNVLDTQDITNRNPLRYRGYYYDTESGYYYLNARYYDPVVHRFLNSDNQIAGVSENVDGYNLFAYCNNNPIKLWDKTGEAPELSKIFMGAAAVLAGAALVGLTVAAVALAAPLVIGGSVVAGATIGAAAMAASTTLIEAAAVSTAVSAVSYAVEETNKKRERRIHTVYKLINEETKEVKYIGRTVNYKARMIAHGLHPVKGQYRMLMVKTGLTYEQARGLEHILIMDYGKDKLDNLIYGISTKNNNKLIYMKAGRDAVEMIGNYIENEILYWIGW
ncbi:MAG: DNRLRE domain-containing protein [Lachnospiraceae bacterium]|nr:DNRLRE domain-containing protein [Lachnospiraceae bacterium]